MDLLFQKYASPFLFLDEVIANGDFVEWLNEFIQAENDNQTWEVWLHKVYDKDFESFKTSVIDSQRKPQITFEAVKETINNSKEILNNFKPK